VSTLNATFIYPGHSHDLMAPSLEEKLIVEHPSSCYVLGRSGTGYVLVPYIRLLSTSVAVKLLLCFTRC